MSLFTKTLPKNYYLPSALCFIKLYDITVLFIKVIHRCSCFSERERSRLRFRLNRKPGRAVWENKLRSGLNRKNSARPQTKFTECIKTLSRQTFESTSAVVRHACYKPILVRGLRVRSLPWTLPTALASRSSRPTSQRSKMAG